MIKPGVLLYGIRPEMVIVDGIVQQIFEGMGFGCVRTSIVGKKHKKNSLHPVGYAVDYRTKHLNSKTIADSIHEELKKALPCCDILLEYWGQEQSHFHIEFDPKDDTKFQADKVVYRQTGHWPER